MAKEFKVPSLGEHVESAEVSQLYVKEGDTIAADQNVLELETEKAVADLPCPMAGRVAKVLVKEGDTIRIGQPVLLIESEEDARLPEKQDTRPDTAAPREEEIVSRGEKRAETPEPRVSEASSPSEVMERVPGTPPREADEAATVAAGPATRRLARQLGVDLRRLEGTARGGRITPEDVVRAHEQSKTRAVGPQAVAEPPLPDFSSFGPIERRAMNKIARTAVKNLETAWRVIPHVTQHETADITELEAARRLHNQKLSGDVAKLTLTAIAIKAIVAVLKEFPHFNASYDAASGEVVLKRYYHIGVAVDTENGLLVPVIRNANHKSMTEIAAELKTLSDRARDRKLTPEEMQGGSFTISNLGGIGGTGFTPIVLHPQVAILGISRTRNELHLVEGKPVERLVVPLSLSYDHRVVNGADGARFMVRLAEVLSTPLELLFEC